MPRKIVIESDFGERSGCHCAFFHDKQAGAYDILPWMIQTEVTHGIAGTGWRMNGQPHNHSHALYRKVPSEDFDKYLALYSNEL